MFRTDLFRETSPDALMASAYVGAPLIVDSFAGGGGASTGIEMALGRSPDIAINHNPEALALHAANHPETHHLSENVYRVDPLDHLKGKHIGLAWFSPDCKHFSKAKGGKPVERNIRDLCWIIPGWIERIQKSGGRVDVVIMENVEEFKDYGPLVQTDRGLMPDPDRRGENFEKWCKKLRRLGGRIEYRELRACDYGAPTIRKRLFVIVRFDGKPIVWPEPTHGGPSDPDVISGRKLRWRTAAEIIDWSLPCPSIFDTSDEIMAKHGLRAIRPLADATMARVARGTKRYVLDAARPFIVNLTHGVRTEELDRPFNTITGANRGEKAVISPSSTRFNTGATGSAMDEPVSTITANSYLKKPGGAAPLGVIAPSLSAFYGPGAGGKDRSASAEEPVRVVTTENRHAVVAPVLTYAQQGGANRSVEDPHHTITASKKDQNSVIVPNLMSMKGSDRRDSCADAPHPTVLAGGGHSAVVSAFVAQHNNDSRRIGGVNPGRPMDEPVSTVTSTGAQQGVVSAFVSRQFGASVGHGADEPSATVTAGVNKSAVVAPFLQAYYGTGDGGEENQPARTITTKDRHGHVEAVLSAPPFTEDQHARAREVANFMRSYGFWDEREFVTLTIGDAEFVIVDIGMRMLTPRELYSAQGFPADYKIDADANGRPFPKNVQVSCVGNSVSPPVAAALVAANCQHLAEYREAAE
ncbi:C-5 cytosine-specific DNA methylase [Sinorhizobium meliloti]|uniref:DNA cytosine methyltransferase n=1 Tax=Rhizobium meliloti TaxID=382 RepID=UPI000FD29018|nr:DNA cytosine methyltransferase [Sinorhizobium meliloti]RVH05050.1 C-5 cytosine-specific DNA methylase [Sinorhizobium meliloti]